MSLDEDGVQFPGVKRTNSLVLICKTNMLQEKHLRANVAKNQTFSKYCGNSSKINSAHILMLGSP